MQGGAWFFFREKFFFACLSYCVFPVDGSGGIYKRFPGVRVVSGGYFNLSVIFVIFLQPFYAKHHFVIIACAHGFHNVLFQVVLHCAV